MTSPGCHSPNSALDSSEVIVENVCTRVTDFFFFNKIFVPTSWYPKSPSNVLWDRSIWLAVR